MARVANLEDISLVTFNYGILGRLSLPNGGSISISTYDGVKFLGPCPMFDAP
jgi:hypothetical protein